MKIVKHQIARFFRPLTMICLALSMALVFICKPSARKEIKQRWSSTARKNPSVLYEALKRSANEMPLFYPGAFLAGCLLSAIAVMFLVFVTDVTGIERPTVEVQLKYVLFHGCFFLAGAIMIPVIFSTPSTFLNISKSEDGE